MMKKITLLAACVIVLLPTLASCNSPGKINKDADGTPLPTPTLAADGGDSKILDGEEFVMQLRKGLEKKTTLDDIQILSLGDKYCDSLKKGVSLSEISSGISQMYEPPFKEVVENIAKSASELSECKP